MAKEAGIRAFGLANLARLWTQAPQGGLLGLSADPMFVEKVRDIVDYSESASKSHRALCDEKSQTQALERSQLILPLRPGLPERQTHDYVRHGTLSLFAAYDAATGRVFGRVIGDLVTRNSWPSGTYRRGVPR